MLHFNKSRSWAITSLPPQGIIERVNLLADVICITQAEPLAKDDNKTSVSRQTYVWEEKRSTWTACRKPDD